MTQVPNIPKSEIRNLIEELQEIIKECGHLDHMVRAVEVYLGNEDELRLQRIKKSVKAKKKKNKNYKLTAEETELLAEKTVKSFYKVDKTPSGNLDEGHGLVHFFDKGAVLYYSSEGGYLSQHVAIAHELGHVLFHTRKDADGSRNVFKTQGAEKVLMETQASYFAEIVMSERSKQFLDKEFVNSHHFERATISHAIKKVQAEYDVSLLTE